MVPDDGQTSPASARPTSGDDGALSAGLQRLATDDGAPLRIGCAAANYFLTGLIIVGPVTLDDLHHLVGHQRHRRVAQAVRAERSIFPDTYLPFAVPGIGLLFGIMFLTAHRRARRQPAGPLADLVRRDGARPHADRAQRLPGPEAVLRVAGLGDRRAHSSGFQKVGLIEFPSKGLWSIVFVTGETQGRDQHDAAGRRRGSR